MATLTTGSCFNPTPRTAQDADNALLVRAMFRGAYLVQCAVDADGKCIAKRIVIPWTNAITIREVECTSDGFPVLDDPLRAALRRALGEEPA